MVRRTASGVKSEDAAKAQAAKPPKAPRKKNRRKQLESQIRRLQKSTKPMLPLSFIRGAFMEAAPGKRVQRSALEALRTAVTAEAHGLFESAKAVMDSSNKASLTIKHLQAVKRIEAVRPGNG